MGQLQASMMLALIDHSAGFPAPALPLLDPWAAATASVATQIRIRMRSGMLLRIMTGHLPLSVCSEPRQQKPTPPRILSEPVLRFQGVALSTPAPAPRRRPFSGARAVAHVAS